MPMVQLVDSEDNLLEPIERSQLDNSKHIYRMTTTWVVNPQGQVLIAKRSDAKALQPGKWGSSVSGTLEDRDTYRTNALTELREEIGLDDVQLRAGPKHFFEGSRSCYCRWYLTETDKQQDEFELQTDEVQAVKWVTVDQLKQDMVENPDLYLDTMPKHVEVLEELLRP